MSDMSDTKKLGYAIAPYAVQLEAPEVVKNADPTASATRKRIERAARRTAAKEREEIARQKQLEELRLAEETGEVERRRQLIMAPKGRASLIATSPQGVKNLGGT